LRVAALDHGAAAAGPLDAIDPAMLLDLGVVEGTQAAQIVEAIGGGRVRHAWARYNVVDMRRPGTAAADRAPVAVAPQRRLA
jgi:hypothetical protein